MRIKKVLSIVSALCIALSMSISASAASGIRGDANGDNKVDIRDAAHIAKCLVKGLSLDQSADFNQDGKIDIRDAASISMILTKSKVKTAVSVEEEILVLVNQERAKVGVAPLTLDSSLNATAAVRAKEASDVFSHTRPNGKSCFTILSEHNLSYTTCGENLAAGNSTAKDTVTQWVNSPGHYANMINPDFTEMGVALYSDPSSDYGYYWVQIFRHP